MKKILVAVIFVLSLVTLQAREYTDTPTSKSTQIDRVSNSDIYFDIPHLIFSHTNTLVTVKFKDSNHSKLIANKYKLHFIVNGTDQEVEFDKNGVGVLSCVFSESNRFSVLFENVAYNIAMPVISIWYMLLPMAALLLFVGYKMAFTKRSLSISKKEITERKISSSQKSNFKIINIKVNEEEEILAEIGN